MSDLAGWPSFAQELHATLPAQAQYVLWGNDDDLFLVSEHSGGQPQLWPLTVLLWRLLSLSGYQFMLVHDLVDGAELHPAADGAPMAAARQLLGDLQPGTGSRGAGEEHGAVPGRTGDADDKPGVGTGLGGCSRTTSCPVGCLSLEQLSGTGHGVFRYWFRSSGSIRSWRPTCWAGRAPRSTSR